MARVFETLHVYTESGSRHRIAVRVEGRGNLGTAAESRHAEFELVDRSLDERLPASASSHVEHLLQLHVHRLEN